jgi:hypothetical protein
MTEIRAEFTRWSFCQCVTRTVGKTGNSDSSFS